jgi:hypothetical protein
VHHDFSFFCLEFQKEQFNTWFNCTFPDTVHTPHLHIEPTVLLKTSNTSNTS